MNVYILLRLTIILLSVTWLVTSAETDKTCGIEIASDFCPGIRNFSDPCCYEKVSETLKGYTSTTTEEGNVLLDLKTSLLEVNADAPGGSTSETTIEHVKEGNIFGRTIVCIPPGYLLCYYRKVNLVNGTRMCSPIIHKALHNAETCFKWSICNGNVCSEDIDNDADEEDQNFIQHFKKWWPFYAFACPVFIVIAVIVCVCTLK